MEEGVDIPDINQVVMLRPTESSIVFIQQLGRGLRKKEDKEYVVVLERFFKERGIKVQFVDMKEKGMSKGEFTSVAQANGGIENMIDPDAKDRDTLALIKYIADEDKLEKVLENQQVIKTPIVRNGKLSTIGYQPDVWKKWE